MDANRCDEGLLFERPAPGEPVKLSSEVRQILRQNDPDLMPPMARIRSLASLPVEAAEQAVSMIASSQFDAEAIRTAKLRKAEAVLEAIQTCRPGLTRKAIQNEWAGRLIPTLEVERVPASTYSSIPVWVLLLTGVLLIGIGIATEVQNGLSALSVMTADDVSGTILLPDDATVFGRIAFFLPYLLELFGVLILAGFLSPRGRHLFHKRFVWAALVIAVLGVTLLSWKMGAAGSANVMSPAEGPPLHMVVALSILSGAVVVGVGKTILSRCASTLFPNRVQVSAEHVFTREQTFSAEWDAAELAGLESTLAGIVKSIATARENYIALCVNLLRNFQVELAEEELAARTAARVRYRAQAATPELNGRSAPDSSNGRMRSLG